MRRLRSAFVASCLALVGCGGSTPEQNLVLDAEPEDTSVETAAPACGDGRLDPGETCDDGNAVSADGCTATCAIEDGWNCPTPGSRCFKLDMAKCGDGRLDPGETCDD